MSMVNVTLIQGRLTRKPELRTTGSGVEVADFNIANNQYRKRKNAEGFDETTVFVKVTVWNQAAKRYAEKLDKGDMVLVEGQLFDDNFEKEGQKTSGRIKIDNVTNITLLSKAKGNTTPSTETTPEPTPEV